MTKTFIGIVALGVSLAAAAESPNITGTWNMGVEAGHVIPIALVLKQDGQKLTGTIALPSRSSAEERVEVKLAGKLADRTFTLTGTYDHDNDPKALDISGKLLDDGTMEGTFTMADHGKMPWTAERLKERK
jgi:hypothetical protein